MGTSANQGPLLKHALGRAPMGIPVSCFMTWDRGCGGLLDGDIKLGLYWGYMGIMVETTIEGKGRGHGTNCLGSVQRLVL